MTKSLIKAAHLATQRTYFKEQLKPEDIGYSSNIFMFFGLPATRLKDNPVFWTKKNSLYELTLNRDQRYEIPSGCYARMNQIFIDTEVKTKNTNVIDVGRSFHDYAYKLGYQSGRANRELVKQLVNYVTCSIRINKLDNNPNHIAGLQAFVAKAYDFYFDVPNPEQLSLAQGKILLNEDYAKYIHKHAAPLDLMAIRTFSRNPLALDFYRFLAYRCNGLNKTISFPDHLLFEQLGVGHGNNRETRARLKIILRSIQGFWPGLNAKFEDGYFELQPSPPAVQTKIASRTPLSLRHDLHL